VAVLADGRITQGNREEFSELFSSLVRRSTLISVIFA